MTQEEINELYAVIVKHAMEREFTKNQILAFLCTCLVGTMAESDMSETFADATYDRMKERFRSMRQRFRNQHEESR